MTYVHWKTKVTQITREHDAPMRTYKPTLEQLVYRFQYLEKYGPNRWGDAPSDGKRRLQLATAEMAKHTPKPKDAAPRHRPRKRKPTTDLIEDIEHLLDSGEGEHAILKAIGYLGREEALEAKLRRAYRQDLTRRIFKSRDIAA